ncbi:MAG: Lrp/AsnC ligand binding domain-containing protein [Deltaproteobacteria bacterium]|nr:Lrp/AsnC ligand binding domain-containing protein [Deltaproteobacteria bacterium]MBW1962344.1 Lrp/AsnC ligand binding domain-containing protein [Deltaproteobacteria bacterium]MBW1992983.1 Lrp/AsnC ligand binding domain-containing protein [Deltaproteobacteria bacterium]MBW2153476.1 Lrp/AsnC ligand binding domain-containing protein [Deltaproteobacteria bacterium]
MVAGVLITTETRKTAAVYKALKDLDGVANVTTVFGRFDIVAMIRALDLDAASKLLEQIRSIDGVIASETLIASTPPSE